MKEVIKTYQQEIKRLEAEAQSSDNHRTVMINAAKITALQWAIKQIK